jgi:hypothetical protein
MHLMVSMSVSSVANKLESTDYLTDSEETQQLGGYNSSRCQLGRANIS